MTITNGSNMENPVLSPNPWDHIQEWDVARLGTEIQDAEARRTWSTAFAIAGGLPFIWRVAARPINDVIYGLLELRDGARVLVIGEGIACTEWGEAIGDRIGPDGELVTVEIILDGRDAVERKLRGRNGRTGCWQWTYTANTPDEHYDCVAVLQSAQHCDDWPETFQDLLRVTRPGGRIVFAEAVLAGDAFRARVGSDVHLQQWHAKMFPPEMEFDDVSSYTGQEIHTLCSPFADEAQFMEWKGIEMFWARKPTP